jgi:hypothetical protein
MTGHKWFKLISMTLALMLARVMFGNGTSGAEIRPLHNKGQ